MPGHDTVIGQAAPLGTAETTDINAARTFLTDLGAHVTGTLLVKVTTARATLAQRRADTTTLAVLARLQEHGTIMAGLCTQATEHLDTYHAAMEQAVTSTEQPAETTFYRPDATGSSATGEAPGTAAPAASAAGDPPAGVSERDRLAREIYVNEAADAPDGWRAAGASEWDTGQVTPGDVAAAYARADEILTARPTGDAPGASRWQTMQRHGIYGCPDWCTQAHDEDQYEQHVGPGQAYTTSNNETVAVRPRTCWWATEAPTVELIVPPGADGRGLVLTAADLTGLQRLADDVLDQARDQHNGWTDTKPAYPGADADEAAARFPASTPTPTPATETATTDDDPGGYYLGDGPDKPYLDWSTRTSDGTRHLEISDGTDAVILDVTPTWMRQFRDELAHSLGMTPDHKYRDPADALDLPHGGYLDWSVNNRGMRNIEACTPDGDTVQLHLDGMHLIELHERLTRQIELDDAARR